MERERSFVFYLFCFRGRSCFIITTIPARPSRIIPPQRNRSEGSPVFGTGLGVGEGVGEGVGVGAGVGEGVGVGVGVGVGEGEGVGVGVGDGEGDGFAPRIFTGIFTLPSVKLTVSVWSPAARVSIYSFFIVRIRLPFALAVCSAGMTLPSIAAPV